jgi:hypothetical protein
LPEVTFGRGGGSGRTVQQQKLALDAQQLGDCPAIFGAIGPCQRLLDRGKSLRDLAGTAQGFPHLTQEREEPQRGPCFAEFVKAGAQQR